MIPFAFIATDAARISASSSSLSTQLQRKLPPGDDGPLKLPGGQSNDTGELEISPEAGGSTNASPMSVYTEVQCNWWQRIAVDNDEDSSGGLGREEYFAFLNVISLDHFEGDAENEGSWQDLFYKLAKPEPVDGDTMLQVSTEGFSSNSVDPKTEKEHKKIREKFCESVYEGLIDEGVEESAMDLAIFMDGLFEDPKTKPKPKPPKPDPETEMETTTTTEATSATTTSIPTTTSQASKSATTTTISSSTVTTRNPTTKVSETTTTAAARTSNHATTEITTVPSPEISTSTTTTAETTKTMDVTTTTATITTSDSTSAVDVDENSQESTSSQELTNTTPATTIAATEAATTQVQITTVATTTSSTLNFNATTNATTTTATTAILTPPQGGLSSELDKVIKVSAAVEQAMVSSDEMDEANEERRTSRPSTGVIVGVICGLAAMVVLIVTVVTRHPFFDPGRRQQSNQYDD